MTRMFLWTRILDWFPSFKQRAFNWLYRYLARYDGYDHRDWTFMNYGYADAAGQLELLPEDEDDRYCCQLYGHVVSGVCLQGKAILGLLLHQDASDLKENVEGC